jgi:5'-3' exonuclease
MANKIILVDWGGIMFKSIFAWFKRRDIIPTYTAVTMLIGDLMKVGLDPTDTVIIAIDSPLGSWRKEVDANYKANRKEARAKYDIDWEYMFKIFDDLSQQIEANSPFHLIVIDKLEADDIISYASRKFHDKDVTIISSDSDFEQLCCLINVKIFSPMSKKYKQVSDPQGILAKKIIKETTDNLHDPVITEEDYERRNKIVNLLTLPKEVEDAVEQRIAFLPEKDWDYLQLPFPSLHKRWQNIYTKDKIVDPTKRHKKKVIKKKTKKRNRQKEVFHG